jgi:tetratricopeptide (TPR) repeat protein
MAKLTRKLSQALGAAISAYNAGKLVEAEKICQQIINSKPNLLDALHLLAIVQFRLGKKETALASLDRVLKVRPDSVKALSDRGLILHELNRFEEALASYDRALKLRPDHDLALSNRGSTLKELGRFEEALASYDRALKVRPDYAEALSNRGAVLKEMKRFEEALASYDRALKARPDFAEALYNRGVTLHQLNRYEDALASYDRALTVRPDYVEVLYNRGVTLHQLNRFEEALASYDRALIVRPDHADTHCSEAHCRLLLGDFGRGWKKNEWRWEIGPARRVKQNFVQPPWTGQEDIAGKTILLHCEQGLGDTIQFCRYVPFVVERGAHAILGVQTPLRELMSTLPGPTQIVVEGDPLPDFDLYCSLLTLPLAFETRLETIPHETPYLRASSEAEISWNARLGPRSRPRIGLAWSGNPAHKNDHNRSIELSALLPLSCLNATYVSLQRDVRAGDAAVLQDWSDLLHFGDDVKNFSDTAAIISNLDLVISVDTSVAHLAGALGKPVWIILPFVPDWRWLLDREDSPWYPTARLFRQDNTREWDSVIARVGTALHDYAHNL